MARVIHKIEATKHKNKVYNVAAYARVSTGEEHQINSLSNQISYYNDLIQSNPQWKFVKIYIDEGISGTNIKKRDGFNDLINDCKAGKIDIVLTKSISRFARNTVDLLQTIRLLQSHNVEVRFEKENINTLSKESELMLTILASYAQNESLSNSENVKWGKRRRMKEGYTCQRKLYGFDLVDGEYKINSNESNIIKYIFKEYINGNTCKGIARELNKKTKKRWFQETVKRVLTQERYAGFSIRQKTYIKDVLSHKQIKNDGILPKYIIKNTNTQIIDKNTFDKVQKLMQEKQYPQKKHWIAGKVRCPECGSIMFYSKQEQALRCLNHRKNKCSFSKNIKLKIIEDSIKGYNKSEIEQITITKKGAIKVKKYEKSR